jgi:hypothetical protein
VGVARIKSNGLIGILCRMVSGLSLNYLIFLNIMAIVVFNADITIAELFNNHIFSMAKDGLKEVCSLSFTLCTCWLILLIALSGDVHKNPGPVDGNIYMCHLNVRSLTSDGDDNRSSVPVDERLIKLDEIYHKLAYMNSADIITISESWLDDTITDIDIELLDYQLYRKDRSRHGGGVLAYVHDSLSVSRRADLEHDDIEALWLELAVDGGKVLIGTYYRPPGADINTVDMFMNLFQQTIDTIWGETPKSVFIFGDFNDKCLDFLGNHDDSEIKYRLVDFVHVYNLFQMIEEPTRVTPTSVSLLDLIITDSPGYILDSGTLPPLCNLDHCVVYCKVKFSNKRGRPFTRTISSYSTADFISLRYSLSLAPWHVGQELFDDINDSVDYWHKTFLDAVALYVPNKMITVRPSDKEWMTPNVRRRYQNTRQAL